MQTKQLENNQSNTRETKGDGLGKAHKLALQLHSRALAYHNTIVFEEIDNQAMDMLVDRRLHAHTK